MTTLALRLAGPLQSWGTRSRFAYRFTDLQPSKSAVLGLLAAAQGRRRTDPLDDLMGLRFGVRRDQPGQVLRDFQTARSLDGKDTFPLTYRFYLADATFVAAVEGPGPLIASLAASIKSPQFPLYLGRRSCPPARPFHVLVSERGLADLLSSVDPDQGIPWQASGWWQRKQPSTVTLDIVRDTLDGEEPAELPADAPLSFDPNHRRYAVRPVVHSSVTFTNPTFKHDLTDHDPMLLL
jgi:CRISPR system Cascade subunit CasD